jgi:hypothetical protein
MRRFVYVLVFLGCAGKVALPATFLSFSSATYSVTENGSNATISVLRAGAPHSVVSVNYATSNGTAVAGADYTVSTGTLVFAAGQRLKTFTVPILNDAVIESNETVFLRLFNPAGGAQLKEPKTATLTILDDDDASALPNLSIDNLTGYEGNTGATPFVFHVRLSAASASTVTVQYATENGSATAGSDYVAVSGSLIFLPGQTNQTIAVNVKGDTVNEADKVFFVNLFDPVNATVAPAQGIGTILNDDGPLVNDDLYTTPMNTPLNVPAPGVLANDSDAAGHPLTAVLVTDVSHGALTLNANGSFLYTPAIGFTGVDQFEYQAFDGVVDSSVAVVLIGVGTTNLPPIARNDFYTVAEDDELTGNVLDNDAGATSAILVAGPSSGELTLRADGTFTYLPPANFSGADSFSYRAGNGSLQSDPALVAITVTPVDGAGDVDLYVRSLSYSATSFKMAGRINPRGAKTDLSGATLQVLWNDTPVAPPVALDAAGNGVSGNCKAKFSSATGLYSISCAAPNVSALTGSPVRVTLMVDGANLDLSVLSATLETVAGKFGFKTQRTLSGVYGWTKTVATQQPDGSFTIAARGVIEAEGGFPVVPTGNTRVTIGGHVSQTALLPSAYRFKFNAAALANTGIPPAGAGAPTVHRLPVMFEVPTATGTNIFETIIELKRATPTTTKWQR